MIRKSDSICQFAIKLGYKFDESYQIFYLSEKERGIKESMEQIDMFFVFDYTKGNFFRDRTNIIYVDDLESLLIFEAQF